ncbi:anti-sigma factor antagonist [Blastococcus sp. TF02-09]|uniref:STAS domain-containing protein n=1 Tax=Blastococcus sp. TF02-09 TaxID=2250576 RepID=UPI000DEB63D0|nr:STAS domain-containing protein [Blastococcus sp. TF02-9]RBY75183.1 anti-sigma factor antagonist [Blastococcus sp. TF02-9]
MAESAAQSPGQEDEPQVRVAVDGDVVSVTVEGELTEAARRPLVRVLTEELLSRQPLRRVELVLGRVPYMNSAGIAVLVQLQRMAAPKGVDVALVTPSAAVARPLQLTGLWHRFPILDANGAEVASVISPTGPSGSPREHS